MVSKEVIIVKLLIDLITLINLNNNVFQIEILSQLEINGDFPRN